MLIKIHKSCREVISICDKELLGKYFEQENLQLDIKESFYKGEEFSEKKAIELIKDFTKEDATFNIVGKKSVQTSLKAGIIEKKGIKEIAGIPYALVLM